MVEERSAQSLLTLFFNSRSTRRSTGRAQEFERKKRMVCLGGDRYRRSMPEQPTVAEREYVLGTKDDEIERLGLQHRVWRPRALDAWRRAGITVGQTVIDVGAGPGHAAIDLAGIVGPLGKVVAVDRSAHFLD